MPERQIWKRKDRCRAFASHSCLLFLFVNYFKSAHPALYTAHRRYPGSQLGPGFLAAHRRSRLVLLHSCPDTVREVLLRKTQTSTPLTRGSPASPYPRRDITSARADCRYRAPLSPRLRGNFMTWSWYLLSQCGSWIIRHRRLISITQHGIFVKIGPAGNPHLFYSFSDAADGKIQTTARNTLPASPRSGSLPDG